MVEQPELITNSTEPVLHGLVNNAGIMGTPFAMTKDGFEEQWQVSDYKYCDKGAVA
jgi:NAD(P)-dependent dehydrogenase (short-subunit alcohol dehydrogenase family)